MRGSLAEAAGSGTFHVDPRKLFESFEECPEAFGPIVAIFREDYPRDLQDLHLALAMGDCSRFAFVAHKIRGSAAHFHAEYASGIARELEERGTLGNLQGVRAMIEHLEQELDSIAVSLRRLEKSLVMENLDALETS